MNMASEHHKVIIIGAGYGGLAAAKTYLAVRPSTDLLVIDRETGVGGVWAKNRIYEGLRYEWPTPGANFSDFDMRKEFGMETWEHISGTRMNEYLVWTKVFNCDKEAN
jgi:cation diffusion facilitator CzcD-associated flavoprotein CzcO